MTLIIKILITQTVKQKNQKKIYALLVLIILFQDYMHQPFGFLDYIKLQQNARAVLSDSGSVSEESAILGFPALTIRDSMERQEALETGSIIMAGISQKGVSEALRIISNTQRAVSVPVDYQVKDTSTRVVNFIASTIHSHDFRNALRKP